MKGISAVAAQEIATGAGVSTATLYRWWETKEALMFDACFEHVMRFYLPRRQIQLEVIEEAVACGELKRDTDPELLLDALSGPLFFRWLQGHAPADKKFAGALADKIIPTFMVKG
jgi:AcrR family transcriptional regulator